MMMDAATKLFAPEIVVVPSLLPPDAPFTCRPPESSMLPPVGGLIPKGVRVSDRPKSVSAHFSLCWKFQTDGRRGGRLKSIVIDRHYCIDIPGEEGCKLQLALSALCMCVRGAADRCRSLLHLCRGVNALSICSVAA